MSTTERMLRDRLSLAENQAEQYAAAIDRLAAQLADAMNRLKVYEPEEGAETDEAADGQRQITADKIEVGEITVTTHKKA
ncbi:hypothetical protein NAC44_17630 [Allorhizobium sp. BGMRC 0089]|uniref:hypothetical protein n=1 Tax=Allorhizobium sonneratiae TaxID=2934936 RepID=UPI0020344D73|nr:hypothetical protein [Allorhizobium sonneratiae]MCM2294151.1 hypothetical protein [Allorhizobium sonneratiae]